MTDDNKIENSLIPIGSTGLVRVGNSIDITNKIIREHDERIVSENFKTVRIGNQEWMTRNLDLECYANGDPIPQVQSPDEWLKMKDGAWCYNETNPNTFGAFGKLYNFYAVTDKRGLAPKGFKIPSIEDWKELISTLNNEEFKSKYQIKSDNYWKTGKSNLLSHITYNLNIEPTGYRGLEAKFGTFGLSSYFWSYYENDHLFDPYTCYLLYLDNEFTVSETDKLNGFSVRCIMKSL